MTADHLKGIEAFEGGVHVILGGSLKGGDFGTLRSIVAERCRAAYLIGPAADPLASDLDATVPLVRADSPASASRLLASTSEAALRSESSSPSRQATL